MFPDLTSDDIFRIETRRLWMRWPRAADAAAITAFASLPEAAQMTAAIPHPYPPGEAERFILRSRADNANKKALVLALTQKSGVRTMMGLISASVSEAQDIELGYVLAPAFWGKGLATEAVKAFIDIIFGVTGTARIHANSRVINPASRRALEKSGFVYVDTGLDYLAARGGLYPCDRFELDRKTWNLRRGARILPPMVHQNHDANQQAELDELAASPEA